MVKIKPLGMMLVKNLKFLALTTTLHEHADQTICEVEEMDKSTRLYIDSQMACMHQQHH